MMRMRKLAVALLISLCLATPSIANDKALHFLAGGLVSYACEEDGLLASAVAGALKEGYDSLNGGEFDAQDLLATIAGGAVVQLVRYGHLRLSDNTLRTLFWVSSSLSLSWASHQQATGMYEINPAMTAFFGEHPSDGQMMALNVGYGLGTEYVYRRNPTLARWLWGAGTAMALYWMASDYEDGIDRPERTYRMSWVIARF
jgi:hypothetical protein